MIVLEGAAALSPFRRERLESRLQSIAADLRITGAWHVYFTHAADEGAASEQMSAEEQLNSVAGALRSQMELMDKLTNKFPHIETFKTQGEKLSGAMKANEAALDNLANIAMNCMSIMGMMQYQDIKILVYVTF